MSRRDPAKMSEIVILDDYVMVHYIPEEKTVGGIILPSENKVEPFQEGTVVKIGDGRPDVPIKVKIGDTVVVPTNLPRYIFEIEGKTIWLIRQTDIIMIKRKAK